ncbi:MAG: acyl-CoA dehydrogenase [Deltaproteobacteria bacterium]|nr:acyl-CoA dehydrogenase [Deltaproteobacteria bacterium]
MGSLHGLLSFIPLWLSILLLSGALLSLGAAGASIRVWALAVFALFWLFGLPKTLTLTITAILVIMAIPPLRKVLFSSNVMRLLKAMKLLPKISETEKVALEAGSVWADGELFSGRPDLNHLMQEPYQKLKAEEQSFLDHQVETICQMTNDYQTYQDGDLAPEVWAYLKKEKFLGLIIPKKYGGLGFSNLGHSEVVSKLGTRSIPLAISAMVPNSLGPAELLIHYGTEKQKDYYLPRLASGEEIPCFGLTEPGAGSDAGAMTSTGVIFKDENGKLCVRLNWEKRYITLGAISTLIGLAVKLSDPEKLLGGSSEPGITCVLVPASTPGVTLGRRHDPLGVPFYNCPISGKDVVLSVDQIIGGAAGAGQGWKMLMECLAAGRSISLPAQSTGGAKRTARIIGAYAQVRKQFGISIGQFEGVGEALAKIGGMTYLLEACRIYTAGALDKGIKPAVVSAIAKFNSTEISRNLINHAMDISGGSGISLGPANMLAHSYIAAPIGVTVEGANILTRTMIIFGQGAIRCHPFAYQEMKALEAGDLTVFDKAFASHIGHIVRNGCRALILSLSRGHLAKVPSGPMRRYYQKLSWTSASFAFLADIAMGSMGSRLKFREKITGRFADILSWMYLITAVLRRFEAEGRQSEHRAFADYAIRYGFSEIQKAFDGLYENMELPFPGKQITALFALWSRFNTLAVPADDQTGTKIAQAMMTPGDVRDALTARGVYMPEDVKEPMGRLEHAFLLSVEADQIMRRVNRAVRKREIPKGRPEEILLSAREKGLITEEERKVVESATEACRKAVEVDSFALDEYKKGVVNAFTQGKDNRKGPLASVSGA